MALDIYTVAQIPNTLWGISAIGRKIDNNGLIKAALNNPPLRIKKDGEYCPDIFLSFITCPDLYPISDTDRIGSAEKWDLFLKLYKQMMTVDEMNRRSGTSQYDFHTLDILGSSVYCFYPYHQRNMLVMLLAMDVISHNESKLIRLKWRVASRLNKLCDYISSFKPKYVPIESVRIAIHDSRNRSSSVADNQGVANRIESSMNLLNSSETCTAYIVGENTITGKVEPITSKLERIGL